MRSELFQSCSRNRLYPHASRPCSRPLKSRRAQCLPEEGPTQHPLSRINIIHELCDGSTLVIRPLSSPDHPPLINEAATLLTEAFVLTASSRKIDAYARFLKREIVSYINSHLLLFPKTLILGAFLSESQILSEPQIPESPESPTEPTDDAATFSSSDDEVPPHMHEGNFPPPSLQSLLNIQATPRREEALVGTVEVSFEGSTRQLSYLTTNSPYSSPYLCNMAVSPTDQRKGIGSMLVSAVEVACLAVGQKECYLHLRFKDEDSAGRLYRAKGFVELERDPFWVEFLGQERKKLMKKTLGSDVKES